MADNVAITAGTGTSIASDDIGGVQYQRVKISYGADGSATDWVGYEPTLSTATVTAAASSTTSAQLLASTAGRRGLILYNTDANACYVKYGTTASATSFTVKIANDSYWEMPFPIYTGRIDVIWAADGAGSLYSTELT